LTKILVSDILIRGELFFQRGNKMSVEKLTLKERVERIEAILDKLDGLAINSGETAQETIKTEVREAIVELNETIKTELEEAKAVLNEINVRASTQIGKIPEIIDELCQMFEEQTGVSTILLRKRVREL